MKEFLEMEKALTGLLDELTAIKSANQKVEDMLRNSSKIYDTAEQTIKISRELSQGAGKVLSQVEKMYSEIKQAELGKNINNIRKELSEIASASKKRFNTTIVVGVTQIIILIIILLFLLSKIA